MKRVITTVGTSLFTNYLDRKKDIEPHYKSIKELPHKEWEERRSRIDIIKKSVLGWAKNNPKASAEIASILKIKESVKDDLEVYLLATDTIVSRLAAEIIEEVLLDNGNIRVMFNPQTDVIEGLQVEDYKFFVETGLRKLVERIEQIINYYPDNVIFNITGGYKGVIPYLTILGQINRCEIVYIYEETETLITIPKVPISVDFRVFDRYYEEILQLEEVINNYSRAKNEKFQAFEELEKMGLVEKIDSGAVLSPIGIILFKSFKNQYFVFYCSDDVWDEIQNQREIQRVIAEKFSNKQIRENKTEDKNGHYVYDDGNNPNRIYYFEHDGKIYIYKTFEDEEAAKEYIEKSIDKEQIIKKSKKREWRLKDV
ncbi:putative CRISPR-associated protein [Thermoanaerobacterium sp. DL9XJH110]|uniref:putative CRISPR-associated protein n=1 Tax=Thermoanaerobacterium sp. DL9XJH110 TaxID=3386643 RepID=UPI003BB4F425